MSTYTNSNDVFLEGRSITHVFGFGRKKTEAVKDVNFTLTRGAIISIVGESGSGKTTLSRIILGLLEPTGGEIYYENKKLDLSSRKNRITYWQNIQAIFQDPFSSFNAFQKVNSVLTDCINQCGGKRLPYEKKVEKMKEACRFVNLTYNELHNKYPFELSGGQMQRIMIARIFMIKPKLLVADEPTSMIDACSRATILDMLLKLREVTNMTIVFITHDIGLAYRISDSVYIMQNGSFVEHGTPDETILNPKAEYTRRLIDDVPKIREKWDFSKTST